jgi:hypothetical protein
VEPTTVAVTATTVTAIAAATAVATAGRGGEARQSDRKGPTGGPIKGRRQTPGTNRKAPGKGKEGRGEKRPPQKHGPGPMLESEGHLQCSGFFLCNRPSAGFFFKRLAACEAGRLPPPVDDRLPQRQTCCHHVFSSYIQYAPPASLPVSTTVSMLT